MAELAAWLIRSQNSISALEPATPLASIGFGDFCGSGKLTGLDAKGLRQGADSAR
jgi:hypothetical protein